MLIRSLSIILIATVLNISSINLNASGKELHSRELIAQLSYSESLLQQEGVLEEGDAILPEDGSFYDTYLFEGYAGQVISIVLSSEDFDTYLIVLNPDKDILEQNDDFTENELDSTLLLTLAESGTYTILVNSFNAEGRGRYILSVTTLPEPNVPDPSVTP